MNWKPDGASESISILLPASGFGALSVSRRHARPNDFTIVRLLKDRLQGLERGSGDGDEAPAETSPVI